MLPAGLQEGQLGLVILVRVKVRVRGQVQSLGRGVMAPTHVTQVQTSLPSSSTPPPNCWTLTYSEVFYPLTVPGGPEVSSG